MIKYQSKKLGSLFKFRGSVFPKASVVALFFSIFAGLLKFLNDNHLHWVRPADDLNNGAFSGFTMILGFALVFRTSQCYSRFHQCSTSASKMRSQLQEAASNLIAFSTINKESQEEAEKFRQTLLRLFSLLHACALEAVTEADKSDFPVLDMDSISYDDQQMLAHFSGKLRVALVYQWILTLVVQNINGLLQVPPPILTRVFQELEGSMVEFNAITQLIEVPFPFPYAQATALLVTLYSIVTPAVVLFWTSGPIWASISTFICLIGMYSLELIACEIEQPFGDDPNDLPMLTFQEDMNASLVMLMNPVAKQIPQLGESVKDFHHFASQHDAFERFAKACEEEQFQETLKRRTCRASLLCPVPESQREALPPPCLEEKQQEKNEQPKVMTQALRTSQEPETLWPPPFVDNPEPEWAQRLLQQQGTIHKDFLVSLTQILHHRLPASQVWPPKCDTPYQQVPTHGVLNRCAHDATPGVCASPGQLQTRWCSSSRSP